MPSKPNKQRIEHIELVFEVYSLIPTQRKITANEVHQRLTNTGIERSKRTVQRCLNILTTYLDVEKDDRTLPYSYHRRAHSQYAIGPSECLLIELAFESLSSMLPESYRSSVKDCFAPLLSANHSPTSRTHVRRKQPDNKGDYNEALFDKLCLSIYHQREARLHLRNEQVLQYVCPLGLVLENDCLQLIYQFKKRIFSAPLNQIQDIYVSTFEFTYPKGFLLSEAITSK
ncbi:WYL domain-containing protein [Vibrio crassostreae]|uniref:hypothetical protein n=1 Tax=Vibrio crassostreae TaxID=246167 RepID=UPI001B3125C0|nr:hypothetical protein [Vibrio crassostreae]CAK2608730.1 WYL domain-containing protein [Vibrio crassostreae]CAK4026383.1 WYL domain-containing protein [Vibrio crassostreae]